MANFPSIIGRSELLEFVDQSIKVPAKIDTGAYRSAIHFKSAEEVDRDGKQVLKVELLGHPSFPGSFLLELPEYELVGVKNSFGVREVRYKIRLKVKLGSKVFWSSFTLADRSNNLMPVLIGRELLKSRFVVDVSKASINRKQLREVYKANKLPKKEPKD